jgi:molybdopterin/thiamine biosynthesis adenylyltransferase
MTIDRVRHGRQIRLPEIGEAGQERLAASEVVLSAAGDAREIEAAYLARAGVRVVDDANAEAKAKTKADADGTAKLRAEALASLGIRDSVARETADGALRALLAMRKILGIEGGGTT